ncbi:MAG TPA: glycosyltransferase [Sumerlaeia bacterium]|nr:glycosyltransferase [Sumerlaeia bacterium]
MPENPPEREPHEPPRETSARRDAAEDVSLAREDAGLALEAEHRKLQDEVERLRAECRSMRGFRGGARELLFSCRKAVLHPRRTFYPLKKKLLGFRPDMPNRPFPPEWELLEAPPPVEDDRPCVLVLSHLFPHPEQPALGSFVLEQARALRERLHVDARVLSGRPFWINVSRHPRTLWHANRNFWRFLGQVSWRELRGVPVMFVPYRVVARPWLHGWSYRQAMCRVIDDVRRDFPFQIVHAHTAYLDGTAGLAIGRRFGVPLVITEHTGPFSQILRGRVMTRLTTEALNAADATVAVSGSLKREMAKVMEPGRAAMTAVIPNAVDLSLFRLPDVYAPNGRAPRLFFVGGLVEVKNLPLLFRAFATLIQKFPQATLTLVGEAERPQDKETLVQTARDLGVSENVRFLGPKRREKVASLLREQCDVLALPSRTETFGCVLIEALACGKPVVATRCGGPEDIITDDSVGRLCGNDDADDLARALAEVIEDLGSFSRAGIHEFAASRFGAEAVARRIAEVYGRLLEKNG